jgi:hypothetical protein
MAENLDDLFMLPLSQQAYDEFFDLNEELLEVNLDLLSSNLWCPNWGSLFTPKRFYSFIYNSIEGHPIFRRIWKSKCTPRVKFFAWLVLVDRLNTKIMLTRCHIGEIDDDLCVMCDTGSEETMEHLFFTCPFARGCWR